MSEPGEVTRLLKDWRRGNEQAIDRLMPLVYDELRRVARATLARERRHHPLQATALVHEAFLRLVVQKKARLLGRSHFLSVAARAMRRILVEHERRRQADKRDGGTPELPLIEASEATLEAPGSEVLDVHRALNTLAGIDQRKARLVELRYFGGLNMPEVADVLGLSLATVERDWTAARLWLRGRLGGSLGGIDTGGRDAGE